MRLYPASSTGLARTVTADVAVILCLVLFAWMGMKVHDGIAQLASIGRGIQDSGRAISSSAIETTNAVESAFDGVADRIDGVPLVGDDLATALRDAPRGATNSLRQTAQEQGDRLIAAGKEQERRTYQLANLVGWLMFLVPALVLLAFAIPLRVRQVRRMTVAQRTLRGSPVHILAARAAYSLPYGVLSRHTDDPFGDLAAGRHAALVAALVDDAGVKL
jgi:hypothetical protein